MYLNDQLINLSTSIWILEKSLNPKYLTKGTYIHVLACMLTHTCECIDDAKATQNQNEPLQNLT